MQGMHGVVALGVNVKVPHDTHGVDALGEYDPAPQAMHAVAWPRL